MSLVHYYIYSLVRMHALCLVCTVNVCTWHLLWAYLLPCCSLQPGDLVLFMQTRDPTIYCALLYTDKVRIFMDKESLERHEKDMKQSR